MSARPRKHIYPDIPHEDVFLGGTVILFRNFDGKPFGADDAWSRATDFENITEIADCYQFLHQEEERIARKTPFAWDADFGFLSPNPRHCGTGLRIQGEFHLEALHLIGDLPQVLAGLTALRCASDSVIEDGIRQAAHVFRVSNDAMLGISESDLIERTTQVFHELIVQEINARLSLVEETPRILEDSISRALAILRHARLLAPGEYLDLLSPVRLGVEMGFLDGITRTEVFDLMREQMRAPELPAARTVEDDRQRDARDADIADKVNIRFANVHFNKHAEKHLL